jgi:hypothetical protein
MADEDTVTLLMPETQNLAGLLQRYRLSGFKRAGDVMRRKLISVQVFESKDGAFTPALRSFGSEMAARVLNLSLIQGFCLAGSLNLDIFRFAPRESSAATATSTALEQAKFDECDGLFERVAGTEDTLVEWRAHPTDATRATVLIATANVIKTLALMRASQVHPSLLPSSAGRG